jgi:putative membrane protein
MMLWVYNDGWPMMVWMGFWNIFWLVLLGLVVWALVRRLILPTPASHNHGMENSPSAQEILRRRYAHGDIDMATFEQMRANLMQAYVEERTEELLAERSEGQKAQR